MNSTEFVAQCFMDKPKRYGVDDGDLNLVNDYFTKNGWPILTREQFRAFASLVRQRNKFLVDNPNCDYRKKNTSALFIQLSIYDYLDEDTATQTKKLAHYFIGDEERVNFTNARVKNSVRNVDDAHITAAKVMLPLFVSAPELKKMRITKDKANALDTELDEDLGVNSKTSLDDKEAGE